MIYLAGSENAAAAWSSETGTPIGGNPDVQVVSALATAQDIVPEPNDRIVMLTGDEVDSSTIYFTLKGAQRPAT